MTMGIFHEMLHVCEQVREIYHENGILRGQLMTLKDHLKTVEVELETCQDKVTKLTDELDEYKKNESSSAIDMDNMRLVCVLTGIFSCLFVTDTATATNNKMSSLVLWSLHQYNVGEQVADLST